jgi:hypothetical protein
MASDVPGANTLGIIASVNNEICDREVRVQSQVCRNKPFMFISHFAGSVLRVRFRVVPWLIGFSRRQSAFIGG